MKNLFLVFIMVSFASAQQVPHATLININRISSWYSDNGEMEREPGSGNSGMIYPRGTASAIYSAGLIWGGYYVDGIPSLRVNGSSYNNGTLRGAILGIKTGKYEDPTSADVRMWRIRKDYAVADLLRDASEYFLKSKANTDTNDIALLRAQYKKDWMEWPAKKGAPFYDAEADGKYTPKFEIVNGIEVPILYPKADEPGLKEADQVAWYVANDIAAGDSPWKTKPIGMEMQMTVWGYDAVNTDGMANAVFKRNRFIFKGTAQTSDTARLKDFYIGQWSDPDLGDYGDDLTGCDTILSMGYVYNSKTQDKEYNKFSLPSPAVGYVHLQGPTVAANNDKFAKFNWKWKKGYINVPLTSFYRWGNAEPVCDAGPPFVPFPEQDEYNNLKGLNKNGSPIIDQKTGIETKYFSSGDPVTSGGWIEGTTLPFEDKCNANKPGDRRMLMSSGPFEMALGDTQEVVYALVGGLGSDRLASISVMKFFAKQARANFNYLFPDNPNSVRDEHRIAQSFNLEQNYPNPFNPTTVISYQLSAVSNVTLKVFDLLGREIATLVKGEQEAGNHTVQFDAKNLPSGLYFYRLQSGNFIETKKMILLR